MPAGLCLGCLLSLGLKPETDSDDAPDTSSSCASLEINTDEFDRFQVIEKIGEGGCGIVYRAEQLQPVRRKVALKVIKLGMDTTSVIARFEAERQALALMDHPGIARVFDAGTNTKGRPFFAMELVAGERLTDYCDRQQLSVARRLELFVRVCEAVQHAHQKGIIHRDLKPSNILVAEHDGLAQPKVIDFGIAKATARQRLANHTILIGKNGMEIPIDDSAAPIRQQDGPLFGVVLIFRDFSERKRAEAELREAQRKLKLHATNLEATVAERTAKLRETVHDLQRFSYSIAHDLRAPLRAMGMFAQLLQDE